MLLVLLVSFFFSISINLISGILEPKLSKVVSVDFSFTGYTTGSWICLTFVDIELLYHSSTQISTPSTKNFALLNQTFNQNNHTEPSNSIILLNRHNFPGVLLAALKLVDLIIVLIFAHDCSLEYNMKQELCKERLRKATPQSQDVVTYRRSILLEAKEDEIEEVNLCPNDSSTTATNGETLSRDFRQCVSVVKQLVKLPETLLLLTSTCLFTYILFTLDLLLNITILKVFAWNERVVSISYASYSAAYFLTMLLMSKLCISNRRVYALSLVCLLCIMSCLSIHVCIRSVQLTETNKLVLLIALQLFYLPAWLLEEMVHANLLARVVGAEVQCFAEGVRGGVMRLSSIASSFLIAMEINILVWACAMVGLSVIWLFAFVYFRKKMSDLKVVI